MLAINVPIPNGASRPPGVVPIAATTIPERATNRRRGWLKTNHHLYESIMSLSPVRAHMQLMQSQNWLPWQRPLDPRSRLPYIFIG